MSSVNTDWPVRSAELLASFKAGTHMTGPQVAKFLGVSSATVRQWRARGSGPRFHQLAGPNTTATYDPADVVAFAMRRAASKKEDQKEK